MFYISDFTNKDEFIAKLNTLDKLRGLTIKSFLCSNASFDFGEGHCVIKFNENERDYYIILLTDSQNSVFNIKKIVSESTNDNYILIVNVSTKDYEVAIDGYKWFDTEFISVVLPPNGIGVKKGTATEISFLCSGYVSDSQMYPNKAAYDAACQTADINSRYIVSVTATEGMQYVGSYVVE